jgi:hypothetical protein
MTRVRPMLLGIALVAGFTLGCGTDKGQGPGPVGPGDAQTPPAGEAALDTWLAMGAYKTWACESGPMNARPNGPHGRNRVCSNSLMSQNTGGEYAVGAAAVKELYDGGSTITGYAVSRHVSAGKTADTWYWYEKIGSRAAADGVGAGVCNGCHSAAGSDASHQGHDYVYLQVK